MKLFNRLRGLFRREAVHVFRKPCKLEMWAEQDLDIAPGSIRLISASVSADWRVREEAMRNEIARLRRNKKKHSHLQKELDALIDSGADTQTNNGDDQ